MTKTFHFDASVLRRFNSAYDTFQEDAAFESRGSFLRAFPRNNLPKLKIDDYVIGLHSPTFCDHVEAKTRLWGVIGGSTAIKFGIYFGKTRSDAQRKYRFSHKFGDDKGNAFRSVRKALVRLVEEGSRRRPNFAAIDANALSQMFKAKILSLYFPQQFLNVCSGEHLELLASKLGLSEGHFLSEYQHLLLRVKKQNSITRGWSNTKFMRFLYDTFIRREKKEASPIEKPRGKSRRRVNFEDIHNQRSAIGAKAEKFALEWERKRLIGAQLDHLVERIEDRRDRPGFGYDFLSYTSDEQRRFIEVKSAAKLDQGHRFFLSDNEHATSRSAEHRESYYFYRVTFDGKGEPSDLIPVLAESLYLHAEIAPSCYTVRFRVKPFVGSLVQRTMKTGRSAIGEIPFSVAFDLPVEAGVR